MARPLRITYPGGVYHVTSSGNERKAVFKSKRDREKFLEYLESAMKKTWKKNRRDREKNNYVKNEDLTHYFPKQ